ncbi:DUF2905 domain-containing protein [Schleiferia thermophila]|uniref:DUF2905 domain-containing protein n=1 Tax=Schleiferia thermophila TaxID=884107 RepID=UPI003EEA45C1
MSRILIIIGVILLLAGIIWYFLEKVGLTFPPRLPSDILIKKGNTTIYFPIVSSILVSIILTLLLYLISRFKF